MQLAKFMKERNLSDAKLAEKLGCSESTVTSWKKGVYSPRADYLGKLCEILDCSADELLGVYSGKVNKLPPAMSRDLYRSVTRKGQLDSEKLHKIATSLREAHGKLTGMELWIRELAEVVYKIELAFKPKDESALLNEQLKLF